MLTIEEYITLKKKRDKLDEFDFKHHTENMAAIMKYVMEYFNTYLNPEEYDYEKIKNEQAAMKVEKEIADSYPESKSFIVDYYKKFRSRIDRIIKGLIKEYDYMHLWGNADYEKVVDEFISSPKNIGMELYRDQLVVLAQEIRAREVEKPSVAHVKYLDSALISWIKDTYREFGVNLLQFAESLTFQYYERYIESIYQKDTETFYHINRYNHRYNDNPFDINEIYHDNSHRPFIAGKKGELEMLIMYVWLFEDVKDTEYWPEYVNLCITTGRVNMVRSINNILPVINKGISYPVDIKTNINFAETTNGILKDDPGKDYILRLSYTNDNDTMWKNEVELAAIISNLNNTFTNYGIPHALELLSPLRSPVYGEKEFFDYYRLLEKSMRKYKGLTIALINGPHRHKTKPTYLMQSTEDIINISKIAKEMHFKLKFAIDIHKLINRKKYRSEFDSDFNNLNEIRKSIIGSHMSNKLFSNARIWRYQDKVYLNKFEYPEIPDLLGCLAALFNDNQCRYFVPDGINSEDELEELTDELLRSGFSFCSHQGAVSNGI